MTVSISLSRGLTSVIDDEDAALVGAYFWYAHKSRQDWYARTNSLGGVRMSRFLMGAAPGQLVDHRNGDTLDNRRANLRLADLCQNRSNSRFRAPRSGYKGVSQRPSGTFCARIEVRGQARGLGTFPTAEEAAHAYDEALIAAYGEFARPNFPRPGAVSSPRGGSGDLPLQPGFGS